MPNTDFAALDAAVAQANNHAMTIMAEKLKVIAADTRTLMHHIVGASDPQKSILWLVGELTRIAAGLEEQAAKMETRQRNFEARLAAVEEDVDETGEQVQTRFELFWRMWNTAGPWVKAAAVIVVAVMALNFYRSYVAEKIQSGRRIAGLLSEVQEIKRGVEIRIPGRKPEEEE